ncbi:MAG TPA: hypothetical protein VMT11_15630 [Myxococcaceae bacterium]|nr:hypothetical protein [Myxococcaceae bacterium]
MVWIRSVFAVAVGFGVFLIGSFMPRGAAAENLGTPPTTGFIVGSIAYGAVFAALGGLTAASLAGRRPLAHAGVLAGVIALAALAHPWLEPGSNPRWLDLSAALVMAPAAALAGWARSRLSAR